MVRKWWEFQASYDSADQFCEGDAYSIVREASFTELPPLRWDLRSPHTQLFSNLAQNERTNVRRSDLRRTKPKPPLNEGVGSSTVRFFQVSLFEGKLGEERTSCDIAPSIGPSGEITQRPTESQASAENKRKMDDAQRIRTRRGEDHLEDLIRRTISPITHLHSAIPLHSIHKIETKTTRKKDSKSSNLDWAA